MDYAEHIKAFVTLEEGLHKYGYSLNHAGFMKCPFHQENTASFSIKGDRWKCFGCAAGGSVIDFVMLLFGLSYKEAVYRIDCDFNLHLPFVKKTTYREKMKAAQQQKKRNQQRKWQALLKSLKINHENLIWSEWLRLDHNKTTYAPKNQDEEWSPLFVEALQKISYYNYLIDYYGY